MVGQRIIDEEIRAIRLELTSQKARIDSERHPERIGQVKTAFGCIAASREEEAAGWPNFVKLCHSESG